MASRRRVRRDSRGSRWRARQRNTPKRCWNCSSVAGACSIRNRGSALGDCEESHVAGKSRLKAGPAQNWPPHTAASRKQRASRRARRRKIIAHGAQPWVPSQLTSPGTGRKMHPARIPTPRSGASPSWAWCPVLAHWASVLRTWAAEESSRPAKKTRHSGTRAADKSCNLVVLALLGLLLRRLLFGSRLLCSFLGWSFFRGSLSSLLRRLFRRGLLDGFLGRGLLGGLLSRGFLDGGLLGGRLVGSRGCPDGLLGRGWRNGCHHGHRLRNGSRNDYLDLNFLVFLVLFLVVVVEFGG